MRQEIRSAPWLQHIAVGVGFCAGYTLLRAISSSSPYWTPQMGLRMALVLLLPRRFWLTLLLADTLSLAPWAYACVPQIGWTVALLLLFPFSLFVMLPAWLLRDRLPGWVSGKQALPTITPRHIGALLGCAGVAALLVSLYCTFLQSLTIEPGESMRALIAQWAPRYLLGAYLGCLILAPLALAVYAAVYSTGSWRTLAQRIGRSRLLLEGAILGLGSLGLLILVSACAAGETWRQIARIAMFLPVAWMTLRYGWQGAAVGGTAASVGIMLTVPTGYDSNTILAQAVTAFAISILLPLGAHIDVLKEQEQAARRAANHDMLTGLPNRLLFQDRLRTAIQRALRHERHFALALVDLDDFKHVNDQYGHPVGDALLRTVAARLRDALRTSDTVARLGGDEFALILEDVTDVAVLLERCQQLAALLAMPYQLTDHHHGHLTIRASASIGLALGSDYDEEQLIQAVDLVLYQAKKTGKNRCVLADTTITPLRFIPRSNQTDR